MQFDDQQTKIIVMLKLGFVVWKKKKKRNNRYTMDFLNFIKKTIDNCHV